MNLRRLDKKQTLRRIDLKNEYKAFLWKKNQSKVKYIESLSNHIHEYGIKFIVLWENLDFFLAVRDKYDDIDDAKEFVNQCLAKLEEDLYFPNVHSLYRHIELSDIIGRAMKSDEIATTVLTCRFIVYSSAYDLLFEVVAKVLSGYTFEVAYYETTNKLLPENLTEISDAHNLFSEYFTFENEEEYSFTPYRLYTANEYILNYDISSLTNIISEITDVNITYYDITPTSSDGKIFEEPEREFSRTARLYEFADEPYVKFGDINIKVSPVDLQKEILVCSVYLGNFDNKLDTFHKETEVTADDVAKCIKNLLSTDVYIHSTQRDTMSDYIEISWIEAV